MSLDAQIATPDHPVRRTAWWQFLARMWKPAHGWVSVAVLIYAGILGPAIERPLGDIALGLWLGFAAAMLGLKVVEAARGVS